MTEHGLNSLTDLNKGVNVSNSWDEVRNERHQTIFQLYVLSSISMAANMANAHNYTVVFTL